MREAHYQRGFTLIEALIATVIFGLVMVGVFSVYATHSTVYNRGQSHAEVLQNARIALEMAVREIRMAGYDLSDVISTLPRPTRIQVARPFVVSFVADVTGDGVLDQVTYRHEGMRVVRYLQSWTGTLFSPPVGGDVADGVADLAFTYFDDLGNPIPMPMAPAKLPDIVRISVTVTTTDTTVRSTENYRLSLHATLMN